jgi:hypothetical protein
MRQHGEGRVKLLDGVVTFRAYGEKSSCKGWMEELSRVQTRPPHLSPAYRESQHRRHGTLMLDAMVYVLRHQVSHMCLVVSSDTDFVPLIES